MEDANVLARITELADEEHQIFQKEGRQEATGADRARLGEISVMLDQCWDLLHQRRAMREAGFDPNDASVRDARTVEGYIA